ncbi:efflux RND transporter periplasmic adaptor subunit [Aliidiomarina haloalkalitolerans]|uniref:Efflux RND transporter periplasmic adaptor subunit n=1 Tax=Aliidiomarina haloalkalitolerans TaxID=859059 RepID=A0A432VPL6_9GAMM|nr:efflux RND transporter periplasmic adaptor subunit [Aliidiomarina haloalkalitolerans]RUO18085.1 efflux RND transporter periplasmic adaptor subunit [Aliidiomarina haloalkalitolerans]
MKKKGRSWLWIVILVVVAGAAATWYFWPEDDGQQRLNTSKAEVRNIEVVVTATGRLQPLDFVDVGAQVSGQLERLHVEVGDYVEAGTLLAEIDATVLEARLDGVRAQLKFQQAQLRERQASLDLALINLNRQQRLLVDNATSEELVQSAEATARGEAARLDAVKAQIEQTESSLRADEANLNYTRIFAPMSGTVTSIPARRGQTLNAAQTTPTILTIADLSVMRVEAQVSEADISRLRDEMPVYFTTLGNRGQRWYSQLDLIEPTPRVENNVVLYNALFDIPNEEGRLLPQMTTQVFFVVASAENALSVPAGAVRPTGRGQGTVQVLRNGVTETVTVQTGISDRVYIEIKSGLNAGDEVIIPAQQAMPGGMPPGAARMMRG